MLTPKIYNQKHLMQLALQKLSAIEQWQEMLAGVDEKFLERKKTELAAEYSGLMTALVKSIIEDLGYQLKENNFKSLVEIAEQFA